MLIIRRKVGERIVFGSEIFVTVKATTNRTVRIAIDAPKGVAVLRGEVHDAIVDANSAAVVSDIEALQSDAPDGLEREDHESEAESDSD